MTAIIFWLPSFGGKYGFVRFTAPEPISEYIKPLSEEEELQQLKKQFELDNHRLYANTPQISFEEYLQVWKDKTEKSRTSIRR